MFAEGDQRWELDDLVGLAAVSIGLFFAALASWNGSRIGAIFVAFLGRLHPIGILLAGLLMALTYIGGEAAQASMGLPAAAIQAFQGMVLFFLLAFDVLTNFRVRIGTRETA